MSAAEITPAVRALRVAGAAALAEVVARRRADLAVEVSFPESGSNGRAGRDALDAEVVGLEPTDDDADAARDLAPALPDPHDSEGAA